MQDCVQGVWVDNETCEGATHVCVNDTTEDSEVTCGFNDEGFGLNVCLNGEWQAFESGDDTCVDFHNFKDSEDDSCGNYSGWWSTSCDDAEEFVNADGVAPHKPAAYVAEEPPCARVTMTAPTTRLKSAKILNPVDSTTKAFSNSHAWKAPG